MELRQLKAFVKAAELLNFTEAAKEVCVTQSSFSQAIKQLEDELDVILFYRNSHEVSLTQAGMELLPFARQTIQKAEECKNRIDDLKDLRVGTLNVGITHSFSMLMVETMINFMKKYPGIKLNVYQKTMEELMEMLAKREVDFVLSFSPTTIYADIESHVLFDDRLSAIVSQDHPLTSKKKISVNEIAKYQLALPAKGLQARNVFDKIIAKHDVILDVRVEMDDVMSLLKLIQSTKLVTMLSKAAIESNPQLKAIPIDEQENVMTGSLHILKDSYRKASAKEFVRMLCETNAMKIKMTSWF